MNTAALSEIIEPLAPWAFDWSRFALYTLVVVGVAYLVGMSAISKPFRAWLLTTGPVGRFMLDMLQCPKCLGYHIGWIAAVLGFGPFGALRFGWLLGAFVTAAMMLIADRLDLFDHEEKRYRSEMLDRAELEKLALDAEDNRRRGGQMDAILSMQQKLVGDAARAAAASAVATAFPPPEPGEPV